MTALINGRTEQYSSICTDVILTVQSVQNCHSLFQLWATEYRNV